MAINLTKSVDYTKQVLNIYPEFTTKTIFKMAFPEGWIKVSRTEGNFIKLYSPSTDIITMIDKYCVSGHISHYNENQYMFDKDCSYNLSEVGDCTKTGMFELTITQKVFKGICAHLMKEDQDVPFFNGYTKQRIDGTNISCFDK